MLLFDLLTGKWNRKMHVQVEIYIYVDAEAMFFVISILYNLLPFLVDCTFLSDRYLHMQMFFLI